jgi:hypothetical protein
MWKWKYGNEKNLNIYNIIQLKYKILQRNEINFF